MNTGFRDDSSLSPRLFAVDPKSDARTSDSQQEQADPGSNGSEVPEVEAPSADDQERRKSRKTVARPGHRTVAEWPERFWAKAAVGPGCWIWHGARHSAGYGLVRRPAGKAVSYAHRVAYELEVGPIPKGLVIDHLCRNRACVNPAHLEVVTHRENILRGQGVAALAAQKTHCPQGHPYDTNDARHRRCRVCNREYMRTGVWPKAFERLGRS